MYGHASHISGGERKKGTINLEAGRTCLPKAEVTSHRLLKLPSCREVICSTGSCISGSISISIRVKFGFEIVVTWMHRFWLGLGKHI